MAVAGSTPPDVFDAAQTFSSELSFHFLAQLLLKFYFTIARFYKVIFLIRECVRFVWGVWYLHQYLVPGAGFTFCPIIWWQEKTLNVFIASHRPQVELSQIEKEAAP